MIQHRDGRYFIHEHPGGISSWQDQCVQVVLTVTQAIITEFDQCLFGLVATDRDGSLKHCRRCSKLVSTMPAVDSIFSGKLCQERHEHAHLAERETRDERVHPSQLCKSHRDSDQTTEEMGTQAVSNYWRPSKQKDESTKKRREHGVRWRDINKGDRYKVNVRSRLVAKEFNNKKCDDLFAGTPPVEAMMATISMAASRGPLLKH